MVEVIRQLIKKGEYAQAIANMHVMRVEIAGYMLPDLYNDFMRDLKKGLLTTEEFSGPMKEPKEFFLELKKQRLGLIVAEEPGKDEGIPAEEAGEVRIPLIPWNIMLTSLSQYFSLKTFLPDRSRN